MPVIFIHGVNTRDGKVYRQDQAARDELIHRLLLEPLGVRDPRFRGLQIHNPYWGDLGVTHFWDQATLPDVRILEDLGGETVSTPLADLEIASASNVRSGPSRLEALGGEERLPQAAAADLERLIEAVLAPVILSEWSLSRTEDLPLTGDKTTPPETVVGTLEALLLVAGQEAAVDSGVRARVAAATSDDEVLELLRGEVERRFEHLVEACPAVPSPGQAAPGGLEALGPGWFDALKERAGELFGRAKGAPGRVASISALDVFRGNVHRNLTQFLGDIFIYLLRREVNGQPGPIVERLLGTIRKAQAEGRPDEAMVFITHSMGGNVLYDVLTRYAPDLRVDVWVSAGGQVGQFEEMKLFAASDPSIHGPEGRVRNLNGRVRHWLNVYDPADILSFLIAPVFADDDPEVVFQDAKFRSGADASQAHGAYFKRPSFYDLVRKRIEARLP